ncbi:MAG: DUF2309 domain-containing protein [Leptospirales bacterium]
MKPVEQSSNTDTERMQLRSHVLLASEIIAPYWPMRTFVHHNPLHGLEHLPFGEAIKRGHQILGGNGYLSNGLFREYVRSGRIRPHHLDPILRQRAHNRKVLLGAREVTHFDVLRVHLLTGITSPPPDVIDHLVNRRPDRQLVRALAVHLVPALAPSASRKKPEEIPHDKRISPGEHLTFSSWCDQNLEVRMTDQINLELIKWCEAFLDEDHATWPMPGREKGFYGAWKFLAGQEWSPCGIPGSRKKIACLPDSPEDALLEHLRVLGIPPGMQRNYLSLHLAALPGWSGFIKWRADQDDYVWQQSYPADLIQYLAVRLWYERELCQNACGEKLGIDGNLEAIRTHLQTLPEETESRPVQHHTRQLSAAWCLTELADALGAGPTVMTETPTEALKILLGWIEDFPESDHGPVWLDAFEAGYREHLIGKLRPALSGSDAVEEEVREMIRPQSQAVFCIDVRSESFRRHLETVGDHETFGFAGFFSVLIRYRAFGDHHETDQFPVITKAKNSVREVPRSYQGGLLSRHLTGSRLLHAGHEIVHDLKENVVTPYVAVESLGWFYSLPLIGKTLLPAWYHKWKSWIRNLLVPILSTALTVDKLSQGSVNEILASEQRSIIRRALQEQFGNRNLVLSLERLEFLRKRALDEIAPAQSQESARSVALTPEEEEAFVGDLRRRYRINHGWAFTRMENMTQIGFTENEQAFTVETTLRILGLTRNFARLVLFCGHGSTSENNPFESALDCGACGGNAGKANARVLAAMANKPQVREKLEKHGIKIPQDTYFIAGQHDTTTDEVRLYDLEDLPHTHNRDLLRLIADLRETGLRNNRERCARFPDITGTLTAAGAVREVRRRSGDWSQVRPEWGLSGNATFIIGRRKLIRSVDLEGRAFLHSYDYREDPTGQLLEIVMTGPQVVGQWINMEHYFSTVDNEVYGGGSKIYHNVVGRFGIMSGPQSDLRTGLARQTVMDGHRPYHEPMRLFTLIEAPRERISQIIRLHKVLQHYYDNEWVRLMAIEPDGKTLHQYIPNQGWVPFEQEDVR